MDSILYEYLGPLGHPLQRFCGDALNHFLAFWTNLAVLNKALTVDNALSNGFDLHVGL